MKPVPFLESASARYFHKVMERFGLGDHGALFEKGTSAYVDLSRDDMRRLALRWPTGATTAGWNGEALGTRRKQKLSKP